MKGITSEALKGKILNILENGSLIYSNHSKKRMRERNYETSDILYILKNGNVLNFSKKGKERYLCEVHGDDLEGYRGAIKIMVIKETRLIVVTVLGGV